MSCVSEEGAEPWPTATSRRGRLRPRLLTWLSALFLPFAQQSVKLHQLVESQNNVLVKICRKQAGESRARPVFQNLESACKEKDSLRCSFPFRLPSLQPKGVDGWGD